MDIQLKGYQRAKTYRDLYTAVYKVDDVKVVTRYDPSDESVRRGFCYECADTLCRHVCAVMTAVADHKDRTAIPVINDRESESDEVEIYL
jgi:hypothetical protein